MKIGVDVTPLQSHLTGVGNYVYYLLKELISLRPDATFYLYSIRSSQLLEELGKNPNVVLRLKSTFGKSEALWSQTTLAWMCYQDRLDFFWGSTQSLPFFTRNRQKNILTIYDFAYCLYPKTVSRVRGTYLRLFAKHFYKTADSRITISKGTAERLQKLFSIRAETVVIPPLKNCTHASNQNVLAEYRLEEKNYLLMVGTLEPRKNVLAALKAYCGLLDKVDLAPLVIVGKQGWRNKTMQLEIKKCVQKFPNCVRLLGYVPDEKLQGLVRGAKTYLMPSIYEGYGMPIAEARSVGTPVICCRIPEMVEAAEGDACFVDPNNFKDEFQQALQKHLPKPTTCTYPSTKELAHLFSSVL